MPTFKENLKKFGHDTRNWLANLIIGLTDILIWLSLALAMLVSYQLWGWPITRAIFGMLSLILIACFIMSFTEKGPFTQLPRNTALRLKTGDKKNIVDYKVNGHNLAVDKLGKMTTDEGEYQRNLRSGLLGLIYRTFGMVYTGFPFIGGVSGMMITGSELDFEKDELGDGSVTAEPLGTTKYYTAIPIYIRRAISYGGIPLKDKNLVDFGIATTLFINDLEAVGSKLMDDGSFKALKGTLESSLRPEIDKMSLEKVLKIRSEFKDHTKKTNKKGLAGRVITMTNEAMNHYGYGLQILDIDIPLVQPSDKAYAKAERAKGLAMANAEANTITFTNNAEKIRVEGMATAEARKALIDASKDASMALFAEGLGNVKAGATIVIGGGVMPTLPLPQAKP